MREALENALRDYGQTVTVRRGEQERACRAFLQPVLTKRQEEPRGDTPLGSVDERRWVYIGTMEVARYDTLEGCGGAFLVKEATPVYLGDAILYWHAMLWRAKEVAP